MTATPLKTPRSGSKLSDLARHLVLPEGIVSTSWPSVRAQLERMETPLDPWQQGLVMGALTSVTLRAILPALGRLGYNTREKRG